MKHKHPIRYFRDANKEHLRICDFFSVIQTGNAAYVYWVLNELKAKPFLIKWFTNKPEKQ